MKILMHRLLHQYRSQSYDSNGVLTSYYIEMEKTAELYHGKDGGKEEGKERKDVEEGEDNRVTGLSQ